MGLAPLIDDADMVLVDPGQDGMNRGRFGFLNRVFRLPRLGAIPKMPDKTMERKNA